MRNSNKLVRGIGVRGTLYPTKAHGKTLKEYLLWSSMLSRCSSTYKATRATYIDATCSENFKYYSYFYEWCNKQVGFGNVDEGGHCWQLDKDILARENKTYSEDTCCFVPQRVNKLVIKRDAARGEHPIGVHWSNFLSVFLAKCNVGNGKTKYIGRFKTPQEAFLAYKTFKEALIKEVANEYKEQLDSRVYEALMNYEVNEND